MITRREFLKLLGALGGAYALAPVRRLCSAAAPSAPHNLLIVLFDTLSARHMSLYGYPRRTTPNLERLARISTVYHQHWAAGNFTMPGTTSLLTGVYPWTHRGLHLFNGRIAPDYAARNLFHILGAPETWLTYTHNPIVLSLLPQMGAPVRQFRDAAHTFLGADLLSYRIFQNDMRTAFAAERMITNLDGAAGPTSPLLAAVQKVWHLLVIERTLARYRGEFPRGVPSNDTGLYFRLEDAIDWLMQQISDRPNGLRAYIHLLPPHEPYTPRKEFIGIFAGDGLHLPAKPDSPFAAGFDNAALATLRREYDEYLAYADAEFGRLLDFLEHSGRLEDTLVVFTSDHGQMFERGIHAHITPVLYEPLLHIPLLIHHPGQRTRQDVYAPTSAVDLLPTLAHLDGLSPPPWVEGRLLPPFAETAERPIFAVEAKSSPIWSTLPEATFAIRLGRYKLIHTRGYPRVRSEWEFYDLEADPEELDNRFERDPRAAELQAILLQALETHT